MRRFLLILIALSLSWVTIGYACNMDGTVVRGACCCDVGLWQSCPEPTPNCSADAMRGARGDSCCSFVTTSGTSAQGQAENLSAPDLPLLNVSAVQPAAERPPPSLPVSPHPPARDRGSVPIYLLIGRLLR